MPATAQTPGPWPTYQPKNKIRLVSAAALFDGHDAAVNIMRRLLQDGGAELIHLGHNRSVSEIVKACREEHVQGVCVSSYQGGHIEFFRYLVDSLKTAGARHVRIFGGGGGTILPEEIMQLQTHGVTRLYSPQDGQTMGLHGIVNDVLQRCDFDIFETIDRARPGTAAYLSIASSQAAPACLRRHLATWLQHHRPANPPPVIGITGTGGAGKSSLMDELILRFRGHFPKRKIAVLCVDPSRPGTTGALLGDRIRMNALDDAVFMRSLSTRGSRAELPPIVGDCLDILKTAGFDLVFLETAGIGQGNADVTEFSDISIYAMTADFGAGSQLEKIAMLDCADMIVINKFDRMGAEDALRDVRRQVKHNRRLPPHAADEDLMIFGTIASRFHDAGVDTLFANLVQLLRKKDAGKAWRYRAPRPKQSGHPMPHIPPARTHYLAEIAKTLDDFHGRGACSLEIVANLYGLHQTLAMLGVDTPPEPHAPLAAQDADSDTVKEVKTLYQQAFDSLEEHAKELFLGMYGHLGVFEQDTYRYQVRDTVLERDLFTTTLSNLRMPKLALPPQRDWPTIFRYVYFENLPGFFPYTSGVFPLRRQAEAPTRMFAGEGPPETTNARFHLLAQGQSATRLSTAFDSVTLYGQDPSDRPDILGKVGESGVSIFCVEDMERLYAGFDLCDPKTSVSMTINGPAPIILAFFMLTATRQCCRKFLYKQGRLNILRQRILHPEDQGRTWQDTRSLLSDEEYRSCMAQALRSVRGTVQADILKEDQAQNTCIFSLDFSLRMMVDVQSYFIRHHVKNYYSVSISGYHIAEAGANPISQLAFTLANGFTYVEAYLARGMAIDDFAPNLSFFFSNGLDPEYTVLGRVARRIWAVAMRHLYRAGARSQKLKYHIQTSGRSLHAQEMPLNDIRTTLQALTAYQDNCNSLHTNAADEAMTTPTEETVRRAMAIQMIVAKEFGQTKNENALQGSYLVEWLTRAVEKAVLAEFRNLSARGGVLGAMETQYQRARIQEESLHYESGKNSGAIPIVGVNTFVHPQHGPAGAKNTPLARCPAKAKAQRVKDCETFQKRHRGEARAAAKAILDCAKGDGNLFEALLQHADVLTLGQITETLYHAGGKYRRRM